MMWLPVLLFSTLLWLNESYGGSGYRNLQFGNQQQTIQYPIKALGSNQPQTQQQQQFKMGAKGASNPLGYGQKIFHQLAINSGVNSEAKSTIDDCIKGKLNCKFKVLKISEHKNKVKYGKYKRRKSLYGGYDETTTMTSDSTTMLYQSTKDTTTQPTTTEQSEEEDDEEEDDEEETEGEGESDTLGKGKEDDKDEKDEKDKDSKKKKKDKKKKSKKSKKSKKKKKKRKKKTSEGSSTTTEATTTSGYRRKSIYKCPYWMMRLGKCGGYLGNYLGPKNRRRKLIRKKILLDITKSCVGGRCAKPAVGGMFDYGSSQKLAFPNNFQQQLQQQQAMKGGVKNFVQPLNSQQVHRPQFLMKGNRPQQQQQQQQLQMSKGGYGSKKGLSAPQSQQMMFRPSQHQGGLGPGTPQNAKPGNMQAQNMQPQNMQPQNMQPQNMQPQNMQSQNMKPNQQGNGNQNEGVLPVAPNPPQNGNNLPENNNNNNNNNNNGMMNMINGQPPPPSNMNNDPNSLEPSFRIPN